MANCQKETFISPSALLVTLWCCLLSATLIQAATEQVGARQQILPPANTSAAIKTLAPTAASLPPTSSPSMSSEGGRGAMIAPAVTLPPSPQSPSARPISPLSRTRRHPHARSQTDEWQVIIDLSHPLHNNTLHWPSNPGFQYSVLVDDERKTSRNEPFHLKSDNFSTAIHSGTHLDAPRHFSKSGWTVDEIPLERLINVRACLIDVSSKVKLNRTYSFTKQDFLDSKTNESLVEPRSIVLVYTGISQFYSDGAKAYFGTDSKNLSEMTIPGFSEEAAKYLVERGVYGVGLDSASADSSEQHHGNSLDPVAHTTLNTNNIFIIENISNKLQELLAHAPTNGHTTNIQLTAAPLPIIGGSGSPIRLVAVVNRLRAEHQHHQHGCPECSVANSAERPYASPLSIIATVISSLSCALLAWSYKGTTMATRS